MLWKIWNRLYDLKSLIKNTTQAIEQRKSFLKREQFGICDVVDGAYRDKIDALDIGMQDVQLRKQCTIYKNSRSQTCSKPNKN